jgi:hypothetical protein
MLALCAGVVVCAGGTSVAQDASVELANNPDFRVRVTAALTIARTKPPNARAKLEHALDDTHPAVRAAAAAALGTLGDPAAIPTLERKAGGESSGSVKSQMLASVATLHRGAAAASATAAPSGVTMSNAKYVLQLGAMRNNTAVHNEQIGSVMRSSAKSRAAGLTGAVVMDGTDPVIVRQAAAKKIPILTLDGQLTVLQQTAARSGVSFQAQVEFSVKKFPEQSLQGTMRGAATTTGDPRRTDELQFQAVDGAVESAMRQADRGLMTVAGQH